MLVEKDKQKLNEPILKFVPGSRIYYLCPEKGSNNCEKDVNDVAKMIYGGGIIGSDLDACGIVGGKLKINDRLKAYLWLISGGEGSVNLLENFLRIVTLLVTDEYCSDASKKKLKELIDNETIDRDICIFAKRSEGETGFENLIPAENIIDASNPMNVVKRLRNIADEKGLLAKDLVAKDRKKGLLDKVKDNRWPIAGIVSLFVLEGLWRHGSFSERGKNFESRSSALEKETLKDDKHQKLR